MKKLDKYLNTANSFAQIILCIIAVFGYFYTVRPIYQKELLSEQIAQKEVQLAELEKKLEIGKKLEQKRQINMFFRHMAMECSGLLITPSKPTDTNSKRKSIFDINVSDCIASELNEAKIEKNFSSLDPNDVSRLELSLKNLIQILDEKHILALKEFNDVSNKKAEELPPLNGFFKRSYNISRLPGENEKDEPLDMLISQEQVEVEHRYGEQIRELIMSLANNDLVKD